MEHTTWLSWGRTISVVGTKKSEPPPAADATSDLLLWLSHKDPRAHSQGPQLGCPPLPESLNTSQRRMPQLFEALEIFPERVEVYPTAWPEPGEPGSSRTGRVSSDRDANGRPSRT